jgi:phosphoglycolate phosphatase
MLRRRPSLVLFDLDGTLVDSAPDLASAIDRMLVALGREPAGEARVRGWIGRGQPMLIKRALTGALWPEGEPEDFDRAQALYVEFYGEGLAEKSRLYPGVIECLDALRALSIPMACVTNKDSRFTARVLESLGILDYFDVLASGDEFARPKPEPDALLDTAHRLGIAPEEAMMVGDSSADAKAARAAGMMLVMVPYGYHGGDAIESFLPDLVLSDLNELPRWIEAAESNALH